MYRFVGSEVLAFLLGLSLTTTESHSAYACGGPFDVACNVGKAIEKGGQDVGRETGRILNQGRTDLSKGLNRIDPRITQMGRDIDRLRLEFQSSVFTGPALEQWIIASRNTAINGASAIPPYVRQALQGWYSDRLLDIVRFKVGDGGTLNLANGSIRYGEAEAVTLIDVIVFAGPDQASDPVLWAHEMKHVQQYDMWGVRKFAIRYMRSWNSVEDEAYAIQNQYAQAINNQQTVGQLPTPGQGAIACLVGPMPNDWCYLPVPLQPNSACSCVNQFGQEFFGTAR